MIGDAAPRRRACKEAYAEFMRLAVKARRAAVRCAYGGLRVYWFLTRPQITGVKCIVTHGDDVLLVRHTYGNRSWDLPGGTVKRREVPLNAARREMREELGRRIEDWTDLGELSVSTNHHHDNLHLFQGHVDDRQLDLDLSELAQAQWFPRDALPPDVGRFVRPILSRVTRS
jgi:8-oxo-dGTP pyrophosphatase MutT (NUDIX family)